MYNACNTPRYMQTACNHMQVGARYDCSPHALAPDCLDSTPCNGNDDLMSPPSGSYRCVMILITNMQQDPYKSITISEMCFYCFDCKLCFKAHTLATDLATYTIYSNKYLLYIYSDVIGYRQLLMLD